MKLKKQLKVKFKIYAFGFRFREATVADAVYVFREPHGFASDCDKQASFYISDAFSSNTGIIAVGCRTYICCEAVDNLYPL